MLSDQKNWDKIAEAYDKLIGDNGDILRRELLDPEISKLLPDLKGKQVLDLGCGNGYLSVKLSTKGAQVTAIDSSSKLLEIAQKRAEKNDQTIDFQEINILKPLPFKEKTFDLTIANLVLMDLSDCDIITKEIHRILKPQGTFIFSILHPAFTPPVGRFKRGIVGRINHKLAKFELRNYFDHRASKKSIYLSRIPHKTSYYHRPISYYTNLLTENNFHISHLLEPQPTQQFINTYPEYYFSKQIALFLVIAAVREIN